MSSSSLSKPFSSLSINSSKESSANLFPTSPLQWLFLTFLLFSSKHFCCSIIVCCSCIILICFWISVSRCFTLSGSLSPDRGILCTGLALNLRIYLYFFSIKVHLFFSFLLRIFSAVLCSTTLFSVSLKT